MADGGDFSVNERAGGCGGLLAVASGVVLLVVGSLFFLSFMMFVLVDDLDQDLSSNIGLFVVSLVSAVGGFYLIRWGRRLRHNVDSQVGIDTSAMLGDGIEVPLAEDLRSVRRSMRVDRLRFWAVVLLGTLGVAGFAILMAGIANSNPSVILFSVVVAGLSAAGVGIVFWGGRRTLSSNPIRLDDGGVRFTNIAFSDRGPTWRGWKHHVGVLTIHTDRIEIYGHKRGISIDAPFTARSHYEKYSYWEMVLVTGSETADDWTHTYLVVRGRPKVKQMVNETDFRQESAELVHEINNTGRTGRR